MLKRMIQTIDPWYFVSGLWLDSGGGGEELDKTQGPTKWKWVRIKCMGLMGLGDLKSVFPLSLHIFPYSLLLFPSPLFLPPTFRPTLEERCPSRLTSHQL